MMAATAAYRPLLLSGIWLLFWIFAVRFSPIAVAVLFKMPKLI